MHFVVTVGVHEDNDRLIQDPERHQPDLAVVGAEVLAGDREVVPDTLGVGEVQSVVK